MSRIAVTAMTQGGRVVVTLDMLLNAPWGVV